MKRFLLVTTAFLLSVSLAFAAAPTLEHPALGVGTTYNGIELDQLPVHLNQLPSPISETVTPPVGDGTTTVFTIAPTVANPSLLNVSVGGVLQAGYVATSTTVAFGQAPPPDAEIVVLYGALPSAPGTQTGALAELSIAPIVNGGTGATTAAAALQALGGFPLAGGVLTGPIVNGPPPSFVQLPGIPVPQTTPLLDFVQGTQSAGVSGQGYSTPMVYLERTDSTTSTATTSDWGNPRLSPMLLLQGTVGVGNVNNPNGLAIQMQAPNPDTAGSTYPEVGASILVQCNPSSGKCRDMDSMNLVQSWVSGSSPQNMVGIEGDSIPIVSANQGAATRPSQGGVNFTEFWAQAAGTNTLSSAGFYASNSTTTNGWLWGFLGDGSFYDWVAYYNNNLNAPSGKGIYVNTAYAGVAGTVASFGANSAPYLVVNGAGGIAAPALPTTGGTVKGTLCIDTTGEVYVKTSTGACL